MTDSPLSTAGGASEVVLSLLPEHMNTWDVAHGGVTMTLADVALAMAARSLAGDGVGVVTVEMKVNFMEPGRGELRATARVLHRSTTMAYCEGEIRDSEGHFVAKALGTFKYMRRLAVGRDVTRQRLRSDPSAKPGPSDSWAHAPQQSKRPIRNPRRRSTCHRSTASSCWLRVRKAPSRPGTSASSKRRSPTAKSACAITTCRSIPICAAA
ncbi:MAG: Thioesterase [uncultured Paraburkholderia sp.]|nr:MAG: Thioesterase [uncultured Paraburkholderia sp.]CAH2776660.1 MAG: Thioesterase [uncultured Paraburkholderia sp.]CAH2910686.1 MAG: Thioesterase [uncultured Paraburkholderia sp.]